MEKNYFIEIFMDAKNNEERMLVAEKAFNSLSIDDYDFDDISYYVDDLLSGKDYLDHDKLNYLAQLIYENLISLIEKPALIDVVMLIPELPAFKATIPNNYKFLNGVVSVGSTGDLNGIEFVDDAVNHPFFNKLFSICLNENGKFNGLKPNRKLFIDDDLFYRTDLLFGTAFVTQHNWMGEGMSLLEEDIQAIIEEFNRPERLASGRENPENYLGYEIIVGR